MKVYIVTQVCDDEYDNTENIGVFSTREKAKQYVKKNSKTCRLGMEIEEWDVD
jgi:hypothetical protein